MVVDGSTGDSLRVLRRYRSYVFLEMGNVWKRDTLVIITAFVGTRVAKSSGSKKSHTPLKGLMSLGVETEYWYLDERYG